MKTTGQDADGSGPGFEATLRLLTHAPVPNGLENRVHASLDAAPRRGMISAWPMTGWATSWMRAAAAAAIVFVVAGGGWGVYRHGQQHRPSKVVVMPAPEVTAPVTGGFSSAGAVRTPQTVNGPAVVELPKRKIAKKPGVVKPSASKVLPRSHVAQPVDKSY